MAGWKDQQRLDNAIVSAVHDARTEERRRERLAQSTKISKTRDAGNRRGNKHGRLN